MSYVDRSALVTDARNAAGLLGGGIATLATGAFIAGWATLLQWLDLSGSYAGFSLSTWFGGALLVLGVGLALAALGTRAGFLETTPDDGAGLLVAVVFGLLWGAVGLLLAGALIDGAGAWIGALVGSIVGLALALGPREDFGSTLPPAAFLGLVGALLYTDFIGRDFVFDPGWTAAIFPGAAIVPGLVIFGSLLAVWSGGKVAAGFGPQGRQRGIYYLIGLAIASMLGVLALLIGFIIVEGLDVLLTGASLFGGSLRIPGLGFSLPVPQLPFLTNVTGGLYVEVPGVLPAAIGTLWLVFGAILLAVPTGVGAAIFLTEYAEQGRFTQVVEVATNGLWSTPSIVFGLFGLAFLVPRISGGNSIVVGQLVLGFMLLPLVVITSREAILAVPDGYRDASAALGVSRWETIKSVVVPAAMPGVITGVILGVGRIAGETAPLLLVFGGPPYPSSTPNVLGSFALSTRPPFITNEALLEPASALPYQLYSSITAGVFPKEIFTDTEFGWGTALVLLLVVIGLYAIGVLSRLYFRKKLHHE